MNLVIAIIVTIVVFMLVLLPFFVGQGGTLAAAVTVNNLVQLKLLKDQILKRYVEEEKAFKASNISKISWQQREQFLQKRYLEISRRLEFLKKTGAKH